MSSSESFPHDLKAYRKHHGLTQMDLARRLHFSAETISAWERGKRRPHIQQIPQLARLLEMDVEKLLASINVELEETRGSRPQPRAVGLHEPGVRFESQRASEDAIREAASMTKKAKILTIRGEKYFMGSRSLLYSLCLPRRNAPLVSVKVLVLSPDSAHISEELAARLDHESPEEIRDKMRHSLNNLRYHAKRNKEFAVRCYQESPNFKLLLFDNTLFVSSFTGGGPKHDHSAPVFQMMCEGNPLVPGFERYFDDLWERSLSPE